MTSVLRGLAGASRVVLDEVAARQSVSDAPVVVAVDGRSGSGKTSLTTLVRERLDAAYVSSDDFYRAELGDDEWARRSPAERARDCINWSRLRAEALVPLVAGQPAEWRAFDFQAGPLQDGTYPLSRDVSHVAPRPIVVLDGAYSSRPELADLLDITVLVSAQEATRRARLAERDDATFLAKWHRIWDEAEAYYFSMVRPPSSFDMVVEND